MKRMIYLCMAILVLIGLLPVVTAAHPDDAPAPVALAPAEAGVEGVATDYGWSQSIGTYTEITGGTQVTYNCYDIGFYNLALPFPYTFNGAAYTTFAIRCNGFIAMGNTAYPSDYPLSSGASNNVISAMGGELQTGASNSEIRYETLGAEPNRMLVVQWKNFRRVGDDQTYNFQIRLYETSNLVQVVYGPFTETTYFTQQVGLRGNSTADFNNRSSSTGWTSTVAGTANTASVLLSPARVPPSGLTWTWTPVSPHPSFDSSTKTATAEVASGGDITYTVVIKNSGNADAAAATMVDSIPAGTSYNGDVACDAGACTYNDTLDQIEWSGTVAGGAQATVTFSVNTAGLPCGQVVTNTATLNDPNLYGGPVSRSAGTQIAGLINDPVAEGFEVGVPPPGWTETTVYNPGGPMADWSQVVVGNYPTIAPHGGSYMAKFNSYNTGPGALARLATYALDFTNMDLPRVVFWMSHDVGDHQATDQIQIQASTDGGLTWADVGAPVMRYDPAYTTPGWGQHTVSLAAYAGEPAVTVGFLGISAYGNNVYLDDVTIQDACGQPTVVLWPGGAGSACPGTSMDYTLNVKNVSFDRDTIDLDVSGYAWPASVVPASLDLGPNETGQVLVTVQVPWGAVPPESDAATVTATARGTGETGSATVTTTAGAYECAAAMQDMAVGGEPSLYWGASYYYGGEVCVVGGRTGYTSVSGEHWCYNIAGGTWTQKASMIYPRSATAYGLIGTKFYVAGGQDGARVGYADLQIYDIATDTWSTGASLPTPRGGQAGGVVGGKLYSAGGSWADWPYDCPTYEYDPVGNTWAQRAACPLQDGRGFYLGGSVGSDTWGRLFAGGWDIAYYGWYAFDPATNTWSTLADLPWHRSPLMVENPLTGDIYSIGGWIQYSTPLGQIWKYDYAADTWANTGLTLLTPQGGSLGPAHGSFGDPDLQGFWTLGGALSNTPLTPSPFEFWQFDACPAAEPDIGVTPASVTAEQCPDGVTQQTLQICNTGVGPLEWSLREQPAGAGGIESLSGSYVAFDPSAGGDLCPAPGSPHTFCFRAESYTTDFDNVYLVFQKFPADWTVTDAYVAGTRVCDSGAAWHAFDWTLMEPYEVRIDHNPFERPEDHCVAYYCFDVVTGGGGGGALVSWYYYGEGSAPAHPCSSDQYTPATMPWAPCDEWVNPQAEVPLCDIPWLSEYPTNGTLAPGACTDVTVTFDSTGLVPGTYTGDLDIDSNDPDTPQVVVPVSLTVWEPAAIGQVTYQVDGLQVQFDATVSGEPPLDILWAFGDGETSTAEDPLHTYAAYGCYDVTLAVSNSCGDDAWAGQVCLVCDPVHDAAFTWDPPQPTAGQEVTFSGTAQGTAIDYTWDFGDGGSASGTTVTHTFAAAGRYRVTMTASNGCGQQIVRQALKVVDPPRWMHVGWIQLAAEPGNGGRYVLRAGAQIVDDEDAVVPGATVYVAWAGPDGGVTAQKARTSKLGEAAFKTQTRLTGEWELCVTDVVRTGWTYDPGSNVVTCGTITVP